MKTPLSKSKAYQERREQRKANWQIKANSTKLCDGVDTSPTIKIAKTVKPIDTWKCEDSIINGYKLEKITQEELSFKIKKTPTNHNQQIPAMFPEMKEIKKETHGLKRVKSNDDMSSLLSSQGAQEPSGLVTSPSLSKHFMTPILQS